MIDVRIKIGDGTAHDTFTKWGLIYLESDHRTEAPIKKRESSSYAEDAGEHLDRRTVQDAFDYTVKFLIEAPNNNLENANVKIREFNDALWDWERDENNARVGDVRRYKQVTFHNDYKRVKIVGIPEPIAEPKEFYRHSKLGTMDCAVVEFKIRVDNPTLCEWDTVPPANAAVAREVVVRTTDNLKIRRL